MRIQVLETVRSRREGQDVLVESSESAPLLERGSRLRDEAVEYVCGECGFALWARENPEAACDTETIPTLSTGRRILVECPNCGTLNVLPSVGSRDPS